VPLSAKPVDLGCGSGPVLKVGPAGTSLRTAVVGAPLDIHLGRAVDLRVCGDPAVRLVAGQNQVELDSTAEFTPSSMVLTRSDVTSVPLDGAVTPAGSPRGNVLHPADGDDTLVLRQNVNPGWTATRRGSDLSPLTIDGWQQGFVLGDGSGQVRTSYTPNTPYRVGLGVGGLTLLLSALLFLWWRFRPPRSQGGALQQSPLATYVGAAGFALASGLLAGWAGVAVFAVASAALWLGRRRRGLMVRLAVVPVAAAGAWDALQPWGGSSGWYGQHVTVQLLMVVPLALVAFVLAEEAPQLRKRIKGFSSAR
jgi:arabinofuranan 3-O-arabinosyltransferase